MSALSALTLNHSLSSAHKYGQNFIMPSTLVSAVKPATEQRWDNFIGAGV